MMRDRSLRGRADAGEQGAIIGEGNIFEATVPEGEMWYIDDLRLDDTGTLIADAAVGITQDPSGLVETMGSSYSVPHHGQQTVAEEEYLYVGTSSDIRRLDRNDGSVDWETSDYNASNIQVGDDRIYFEDRDALELVALEKTDGTEAWTASRTEWEEFNTDRFVYDPYNHAVYTYPEGDGNAVEAFDAADGEFLGGGTRSSSSGISDYPGHSEDFAYYASVQSTDTDRRDVYAVNMPGWGDDDIILNTNVNNGTVGTFRGHENRVYFWRDNSISSGADLRCYEYSDPADPESHSSLWSEGFDADEGDPIIPNPDTDGVFIGDSEATHYIDGTNGSTIWSRNDIDLGWDALAISPDGESVYIADGSLYQLDLETGDVLMEYEETGGQSVGVTGDGDGTPYLSTSDELSELLLGRFLRDIGRGFEVSDVEDGFRQEVGRYAYPGDTVLVGLNNPDDEQPFHLSIRRHI